MTSGRQVVADAGAGVVASERVSSDANVTRVRQGDARYNVANVMRSTGVWLHVWQWRAEAEARVRRPSGSPKWDWEGEEKEVRPL